MRALLRGWFAERPDETRAKLEAKLEGLLDRYPTEATDVLLQALFLEISDADPGRVDGALRRGEAD